MAPARYFWLLDFLLDARFFRYRRFLRYDLFLHYGQNFRGRFVFHDLHLSMHFLRLGQRVPSGSRIDPELRCHRKEKSTSEEERAVQCYG
jgi:hypothetical protein